MAAGDFGKLAVRVTHLRTDSSGVVAPSTVYRRRRKTKKGSRAFRPIEKDVRRMADAIAGGSDTYLSRHKRSNRKRKDGWLRDFNLNAGRGERKGVKRLKLRRLIGL